ncbi:MAG: hypothetical protein ACPLPW_07475 [bacterium]
MEWLNKVQEETLFLLLLPFQVEIISKQSGDDSQEHPIGSPQEQWVSKVAYHSKNKKNNGKSD